MRAKPSAAPVATPSNKVSTARISGTVSSAATKCISDVPGLVKHLVTPAFTSVRIRAWAPFIAAKISVTLAPVRFRADRPMRLAPATVLDYRELARRRLPRQLFDYLDGGAYEEATLRANVADLERLLLRQIVMRDVSIRDPSVELFGRQLALPVILAPVGLGGMFAQRAEVQAARAADAAGVPFVESTVSICSIEEVAGATSKPPWFQLYVMRDRSYAEGLMARARAVGSPVLLLTVDLAVVGARHRDIRNALGGRPTTWAKVRRGVDLVSHTGWIRSVALGGRPLTFGN